MVTQSISAVSNVSQVALKPQNEVNVERIVNEMKNNALATSNWEQLVGSAPVALRCLGACFMAAGSKDLTSVKVPMMPGAKVQRSSTLILEGFPCLTLFIGHLIFKLTLYDAPILELRPSLWPTKVWLRYTRNPLCLRTR